MNKNNDIHRLELKNHKRFRLLSNNEIKDFINNYYKIDNEEYYNMVIFCINDFGINKFLRDIMREKDFEELQHHAQLYCRFMKLDENNFKVRDIKYFYFMTATGKDKIRVDENNIKIMFELNKKIFSNETYKRFYKVFWNIETGKYINDSNLHTHALIIFDKTNKNFDRDYKNLFRKAFGNIDLDIKKFGWRGNKDIYEDKLNYLKNVEKSILHKNYKDLEIFENLSI